MKVIPFAATPAGAPSIAKAPRLSCCCRLSELLPLVRQLHDEARAARAGHTTLPLQQAA